MSKRLLRTAATAVLLGLVAAGCSKKSRRYTSTTTSAVTSANTTTTSSSSSTTGTAPVSTSTTPATTPPTAPAPGTVIGTGMFSDLGLGLPDTAEQDWTVAAGDFDGDGTDDLAIGVYNGAPRLLTNAKGVFSEKPGALPATPMRAADMHAVDIDNDNDLDLVVACNFEPVRVFLNDGQGTFTLGQEVVGDNGCFTYKIALGDVDNDGDVDVFMANAGQYTPTRGQNLLLRNDGTGKLEVAPAGTLPALNDDSIGAVLVDVNGDTYLDIFVANFGTAHRLLINDGAGGQFLDQSDAYLPPGLITYGTCAVAADFDRDGRVDIFVGNEGAPLNGLPPGGERNLLLRQLVGGKFEDAASRLPATANATFNVRAVDVDGDGWLDLALSNLRAEMRLLLNQNGVFVDASANLTAANTPAESLGLAVLDADADTVPDLVFVRRGEKPLLLRNMPNLGAAAAAAGPAAGAP